MAGKRISALTEQTGLSSGDFFGVDNAGQTASKKLNSEYFTKRFANVQNDTAFPTGDAYSSSSSYKVGDYVTHNDVLYRCKTACSAASWTVNATNFKEASLTKAVTDLNSALSQIDTTSINTTITGNSYIGNATITLIREGQLVYITFDGTRPTYDIPLATALANVPEQYRPKHNQMIPAITLSTDGGGAIALAHCTILTTGNFVMDMKITAANSVDVGRTYNRMIVRTTYSLL